MKHRSNHLIMGHSPKHLWPLVAILFAAMPLVLVGGCSQIRDETPADEATETAEVITDEVAPAEEDDAALPLSEEEEVSTYTADKQRLLYYGEVLAYRYGVEVTDEEWLNVADEECSSYMSGDSRKVYGPASAETLAVEIRSDFLLEAFVFLVAGSEMCVVGPIGDSFDRYGTGALTIFLSFTTTIGETDGYDLDIVDFANHYDLELELARNEYADPTAPLAPVPFPDDDDSTSPDDHEAPDTNHPGLATEHEGNSGGLTMCNDRSISQSSGSGTCSWHGGES